MPSFLFRPFYPSAFFCGGFCAAGAPQKPSLTLSPAGSMEPDMQNEKTMTARSQIPRKRRGRQI